MSPRDGAQKIPDRASRALDLPKEKSAQAPPTIRVKPLPMPTRSRRALRSTSAGPSVCHGFGSVLHERRSAMRSVHLLGKWPLLVALLLSITKSDTAHQVYLSRNKMRTANFPFLIRKPAHFKFSSPRVFGIWIRCVRIFVGQSVFPECIGKCGLEILRFG